MVSCRFATIQNILLIEPVPVFGERRHSTLQSARPLRGAGRKALLLSASRERTRTEKFHGRIIRTVRFRHGDAAYLHRENLLCCIRISSVSWNFCLSCLLLISDQGTCIHTKVEVEAPPGVFCRIHVLCLCAQRNHRTAVGKPESFARAAPMIR
jgi:hypothetical protein